MIKFLINRPISVIMFFLACSIVGIITLFSIPVSLLPNIPIPEITVQITGENTSSRALENTVVSHIRQQLAQLSGLKNIETETRDGSALVRLSFEYGKNTDLAFIEVNEKIDASMNHLPREVERPRIIKASATDIPVEYLNLTLGSDIPYEETNEAKFLELSEFAEIVVKRRIEQLPEISMVDITGLMNKQVVIVPDNNKLEIAGISLNEIEQALNQNNVEPGSMIVRDGHYEYNIRFSTVTRTLDDIRSIYLRKNNRIYQLSDLATINYAAKKETGMALFGGKRCIKLAIIKQSDVNMDDMQTALNKTIKDIQRSYPEIEIHTTENHTELLDYTISNLQQNLILAFIFVWLISVFFMKDIRSPFIIGISMVVSVVVSLLLFYLLHLSINIVSLTGLILASGNMIDNSIVVTDNINQYRKRGLTPEAACIKGTNEVAIPMLSSALSSISVFAPLIFMSGIAGALFFDQALSVTIGLMVSYLTGIVLLPVLYNALSALNFKNIRGFKHWHNRNEKKENVSLLQRGYHHGIDWTFKHKALITISMILVLPLCALLFYLIPKEKMPDLHQRDLVASVEWNENIHIKENLTRVRTLLSYLDAMTEEQTGLVGQQQFLLNREQQKTSTESELYLKVSDTKKLIPLEHSLKQFLQKNYPLALVTFSPAGTIFEKVFSTGEADLVVECYPSNRSIAPDPKTINLLIRNFEQQTGEKPEGVSFQQQLNFHIDQEKLLLYNIPYGTVSQALKTAFQENSFATLRSYQQYLPIVLGDEERTVKDILSNTLITTSRNADKTVNKLTLDRFVTITLSEDIKTLVAGKAGEFIPVKFYKPENPKRVIDNVQQVVNGDKMWDLGFSGSFLSNRKMIGELMVILLVSILLMYFLLAAQFENFVQPLIVLMEIPIDITASMLLLMALGHTLNLMSAIGMVVTCGIVINDSILKVDIMNQLRKEGFALMDAIHEAGKRRLNAILMTSLTSIVCMVPLLFTNDLGSNLEKPLALATIGGMLIGTPVSLFVVPLLYWWIYRKKEVDNLKKAPK